MRCDNKGAYNLCGCEVGSEQRKRRSAIIKNHLLLSLLFLLAICRNVAAQSVEVFAQLGHSGMIQSVAFSPDGRHIISGSGGGDDTIKLWDVATGREIRTFSGHKSYVSSVAFSPDGKQIISGSYDNTIKLWDTATGREIRTFSGHTDSVSSAAFSPDGKQIISGSRDKTIKLWDAATGREIRTFSGHTDSVSSVTFSHDGRQMLSGSGDTLKLWDMATGHEIREIKILSLSEQKGYIYSVAFSPDSRQILSGSGGYNSDANTIKLWDTATGREIRSFTGHEYGISSVTFNHDGRQIISGAGDNTIKLWDVATGREIRTFSGHTGIVQSVAFSPDGKRLLSGSWDTTIKLWDVATGMEVKTFSGYTSAIQSINTSPNGNIFTGSFNGTINSWDIKTGQRIRIFFDHADDLLSLAINSNGNQIVSGSGRHDGERSFIKLWDAAGRIIRTIQINDNQVYGSSWVNSVSFSPDGRQLVSGHGNWNEGSIRLWDIASGNEIKTIYKLEYIKINSVAFSHDGKQIVSDSYDNTVKLWDTATGREIRTFSGHTSSVITAAFSPDGKQIVSGSYDNTIKLWDTATGREIHTFSGHKEPVNSAVFSPDGRQILSCSWNSIKLWDVAKKLEFKSFSLGNASINNAAIFSQDGRHIFSGSFDGSTHLWDIATGKEIAQFISFIDGEWIVLTPDGYYNSSPNGDKYLNVRVGNQVFGIDQYRSTFYNPQIVEARLQGKPDPVRVTQTIQTAGSPPAVVIRNPENGTSVTTSQAELSVSVVDATQSIRNIQVLVNGRLIGGETLRGVSGIRGIELETTGIRLNENQNRVEFRLTVSLDPGNNRIEVIARNSVSEGRDTVDVTYRAASQQNILPNLWILSIGANRYSDNRLPDLNYAVNDAKGIVDALKAQRGRLYRSVNVRLIADGEAIAPTYENILDNFNFLKQAGQNDVVMLFIAGHGMNDDGGNFHFMPSDAAFDNDGSIRPSKAISWRQIQSVLDVPGQKLVFIDACHSEGSSGRRTRSTDNNNLVRSLQDKSTVIFTSSRGSQLSQESDQFKHGIFTYAILQGLRGEADLIKDGKVTMKELDTYVSETVPKLTNGLQHPTTSTPDGYVNFVVADVK